MKQILEAFDIELDTAEEKDWHRKHSGKWTKKSILIAVILAAMCAALLWAAPTIGCRAAKNAYDTEKENAANAVYEEFYQKGYQDFEVVNTASIQLESLKSEAKLEVLKAYNVVYQLTEEKQSSGLLESLENKATGEPTVWLEVPGEGAFTVNMRQAEFVIDEVRQYVLIRIPEPEISSFSIDYSDVRMLYSEEGGVFNRSVRVGDETAKTMLEAAESNLKLDMQNNQRFYQAAKNSAKRVLTDWVKKLNPDLPDIQVDIQLMEDT